MTLYLPVHSNDDTIQRHCSRYLFPVHFHQPHLSKVSGSASYPMLLLVVLDEHQTSTEEHRSCLDIVLCIPFNSEVDRKQHLLLHQTPHPCTVPAPYLRHHAVLAALTLHTDVGYLICLLLLSHYLFIKSFALSVFQLLPTSHVYCLTNTLHTPAKHTTHSSPLFRCCSSNVGCHNIIGKNGAQ